jgi:two-component system, NtrC family, nitrogen regulation response regulator NtrX
MAQGNEAGETVLIVDDEESVRKTFREWLESGGFGCEILTALDAESALVLANQRTVDLAILDWNLGAGNDGLKLLEDLYLFNPDVVAIMITGYAHQATPLDALRMGVRDYFDKNQHLDRDTFLAAVRRQLERIRPAKRERLLHRTLVAFREAVEKVLPLVESAAKLNDPVPLPDAIRSLFRFLLRTTAARDGALFVRSYDPARQPAEICRVFDADGMPLEMDLVPFARSVAGTVVALQEPYVMTRLDDGVAGSSVDLQPFERGRQSLLAAPIAIAPGMHVVLELFDKQGDGSPKPVEFTAEDRKLAAAAADFGAEMLRQALAQRQMHQVLFDAIGAALGASESVAQTLRTNPAQERQRPPPQAVLDQLRESLSTNPGSTLDAGQTLQLAEAVRLLAVRHGETAVRHCTRLIHNLCELLDSVSGTGRSGRG